MANSSMRRCARPSKLALTLSLFFLSTLATGSAVVASSEQNNKRDWRPDTELPGAPFVLGDGTNTGRKVIGYTGEWPLWSSFRSSATSKPAFTLDGLEGAMDAVSPAGLPSSSSSASSSPSTSSSTSKVNGTSYVCVPVGECVHCPEDVVHLPYCRPYNNRRRVACAPVKDRNDAAQVQAALRIATNAKDDKQRRSVLMGYEACGKSAKQEARDFFELFAVVASIAIFSVWTFIQRQKTLFVRQNQQLQSRVMGRRSSGLPPLPPGAPVSALQGNRKKRAARLAAPPRG